MSLYDYIRSIEITVKIATEPFYAVVMALMRLADTDNREKLRAAWPEVWNELQARYMANGGILPEDRR